LTLEGAGSASTFIDGGAAASVIDINVFGGPEVIITDLTIQNGSADKGAGIYAATSVTINNAVITQNLAANYGGGIYVYDGPLILDNTTVSDNEAGLAGGGIDNRFDSAITNSQILNNRITTPSPAVTVGGAGIHNRSNLTITDSSIVGNTTTGGGGGVFNNAYQDTLTLTNVIVDGNEALTYGAGIYNYGLDGSLVIEDSQVINNTTTDPVSEGAGVYNRGTATITDSTISGNTSGWTAAGIMQRDGVMVLTGTDVVNNATSGRGGGIFVGNGTLELDNSPVDANTAVTGGGGIYAGGWTAGPGTAVTLVDSTISNNSGSSYGGGIYTSVLLTLVSSTLSGNTATVFGGGIYGNDPSGDVMTLTNCTVSNNTADNSGGGVYLQSQDAVLNNCTISSNSSPGTGGIRSANTVTVRNSIIANQISGIDCSMAGNSIGYNLESGTSCGFTAIGDQQSTDPLLLPLANYGGPTETHALPFDSPAVDSADPAGCWADQDGDAIPETDLLIDQRGQARVDIYAVGNDAPDEFCDIGAYEFDPYALAGDFEEDADGDGLPDQWFYQQFVAGVDGQDCTQAYTGSCSLLVQGDGTLKKAKQLFHQAGLAGDSYTLTLRSSADNAGLGRLRAAIRVRHTNGTSMYEFVNLDKGTHDWQEYTIPFTTTDDYDFIRVLPLISELQSGSAQVDSVILTKN